MLITPNIEIDEGRLADICDRYGIAELRIFGSQARQSAYTFETDIVPYSPMPRRR